MTLTSPVILRRVRPAVVALAIAVIALARLVGVTSANEGPTSLYDPSVSPASATVGTAVTFQVTYRNHEGSAPDNVDVIIDGNQYPMSPAGSDWKHGVTLTAVQTLAEGTHDVSFAAIENGKFIAQIGAGQVSVVAPTPSPTPEPTPTPTPRPTPAPTPTPQATPTPTPRPTATPAPTPAPTPTPRPTVTPAPTATPHPTATPAPTLTPTATPTQHPTPTASPAPTSTPQPNPTPTNPATTPVAPTPTGTPAPGTGTGSVTGPGSGSAGTDGSGGPGGGPAAGTGAGSDPGLATGGTDDGTTTTPYGPAPAAGDGTGPAAAEGAGTEGAGPGSGATADGSAGSAGGTGETAGAGAPNAGDARAGSGAGAAAAGDPLAVESANAREGRGAGDRPAASDFGSGALLVALGAYRGIPLQERMIVSVVATGGTVSLAMAFLFFGKRRRDGEPTAPDEVLASSAGRMSTPIPAADLVPAPALAPIDMEADLPRWRRPSLLAARKADPLRSAAADMRLSFDRGSIGPVDGHERRRIRYRLVRLLDTPDELRGTEMGFLDQGDEVQLLERSGAYWLVLCPDGSRGWIHKMTLGDRIDPDADADESTFDASDDDGYGRVDQVMSFERAGLGDPWGTYAERDRMAESIDEDVLQAFLQSRRQD